MLSYKLLFSILFVLLSSSIISAQDAYKIGEISQIFADTSENPELNVAVQKMKDTPKAKLAIISYGLPGIMARRMYGVTQFYKLFFKTDINDFLFIYGGYENAGRYNRTVGAELWIVPENAAAPKVDSVYPKDAYLFDEFYWKKGESGYDFDFPPIKALVDFLEKNPQNEVSIIYYGYRDKGFGVSSKVSRNQAIRIKTAKAFSDIKYVKPTVLSGGYSKEWAHIEIWITPPGAKRPQPTLTNKSVSKERP